MVRHYLINTLVNWRECIRNNEMQRAYRYTRSMYGMSKAEALKMLDVLQLDDSGTSNMNGDIRSYVSY
ncbi:hypothetical protein V6E27_28795 [Bacillus cereus]|uniref:hypothetical protein n=1 Tax=Bacillus cereus group TaxID=86661 RepID=UPI002FD950DD